MQRWLWCPGLWGRGGQWGGDSSRSPLNQGSRLATFLASSPQAWDPSALWLLPAHSCADASARVLLREAKK